MIPITDVKTMRKSDADTIIAGTSGSVLMARAGRGIYESYPWKGPVAIVCGSGNNAGDGYVLALELFSAGIDCTLVLLSDRFSKDAQYYYEECTKRGIASVRYTSDFSFASYSEIADCILGTGFSGVVSEALEEVFQRINESGKTVISADINSGLHGDSGLGNPCVRSDLTVSVGAYKTGHFLGDAKDVIGSLVNVDAGISVPRGHVFLCEAEDFFETLSARKHNSHKGNYGYVALLGGCREYAGAVKLANLSASALRAGCGVAQLAIPDVIEASVSPYLLESTLFPIPSDAKGHMLYDPRLLDTLLSRVSSVAVGMGWGTGDGNEAILKHLLTNGAHSLVIDADGLNTLSRMGLSILRESRKNVVLTPHLKEFERLSGKSIHEVLAHPVECAEHFAREYGVILLLKGTTTVVTDGKETLLVDRGSAGMATAGSGDVLSGILAGLLGYAPFSPKTVACGAYIAGLAGELASKEIDPIATVASDTVRYIAQAITDIKRSCVE